MLVWGGVVWSGEHRAFFEAQAVREADHSQARAAERSQPMPTTIEGFKSHPTYVLDRHLGRSVIGGPATHSRAA